MDEYCYRSVIFNFMDFIKVIDEFSQWNAEKVDQNVWIY